MEASTSFKAAITLPSLDNKKIDINVQKGQNVKDLVYHLTQHHAIPPYLTNSLYSSIVSIMSETCEKDTLYNQKKHTSNKQELRQRFMDAYQSNTLQYNNKPEEVKKKRILFISYFLLIVIRISSQELTTHWCIAL